MTAFLMPPIRCRMEGGAAGAAGAARGAFEFRDVLRLFLHAEIQVSAHIKDGEGKRETHCRSAKTRAMRPTAMTLHCSTNSTEGEGSGRNEG